jgi:hypothetical protein
VAATPKTKTSKALKRLVRARMAETGESYTASLRFFRDQLRARNAPPPDDVCPKCRGPLVPPDKQPAGACLTWVQTGRHANGRFGA